MLGSTIAQDFSNLNNSVTVCKLSISYTFPKTLWAGRCKGKYRIFPGFENKSHQKTDLYREFLIKTTTQILTTRLRVS